MKINQRFAEDLRGGKNLDAYLAILIGLVLFVLAVIGVVKFEFIAAGILLVISFGIWTSLENRHEISELKESMERMNWPTAILGFANFPDNQIRQNLRSAQEISLTGLSLFRFLPMYFTDIEQSLQQGASLRIVLSDPASSAVEMAAFRSDANLTVEQERQRIIQNIGFIAQQFAKHPEYRIELRTSPLLSGYSIVVVKPFDKRAKSYCHARLTTFRTPSLRAPTITPDSEKDSIWFEFIEDQFKGLWEASSTVDLAAFAKTIKSHNL